MKKKSWLLGVVSSGFNVRVFMRLSSALDNGTPVISQSLAGDAEIDWWANNFKEQIDLAVAEAKTKIRNVRKRPISFGIVEDA